MAKQAGSNSGDWRSKNPFSAGLWDGLALGGKTWDFPIFWDGRPVSF
jgi:hypothetical protein